MGNLAFAKKPNQHSPSLSDSKGYRYFIWPADQSLGTASTADVAQKGTTSACPSQAFDSHPGPQDHQTPCLFLRIMSSGPSTSAFLRHRVLPAHRSLPPSGHENFAPQDPIVARHRHTRSETSKISRSEGNGGQEVKQEI